MFAFKNISKRFGQRAIAEQINLQVNAGEMLAILGASGSGKSTLLHIAAGLQNADGGEVWLNGENITFRQPEKREIAMMFQDFALFPHLNVWQNVAFGLRLRGVGKAAAREQAQNWLAKLNLRHAADRAIAQLSGGEQQRVALARALIVQPKLLLLDEPFSSLDSSLRHQLQHEIAALIREQNIPALLVSHDPAEAALTAQRIALLADGQIIQHDTPAELFRHPLSAQAARLLGCLNVNAPYYIPPQAIELTKQDGENCAVLACCRQPANWRVLIMHPKWGELTFFANQFIEQTNIYIHIDETQIVHFA